jgi:hypothetical protein
MKKPIEFQSLAPGDLPLRSPLVPSSHIPYNDLLIRPEYAARKYTLPKGTSTFRLLPPIKGSDTWMASIKAIDHGHGRHLDPRTFGPNEASAYATAQMWLRKHQPGSLYAKTTPDGHKLWPLEIAACWILIDGPEPPELKILISSEFPGSQKGVKPGLAHMIKQLAHKQPELLDPDAGYQLKVTRAYSAGNKYPATEITVHQTATSLNEMLGELPTSDLKAVCPIQETLRRLDAEHEWALLSAVIGNELAAKIRAVTAAP